MALVGVGFVASPHLDKVVPKVNTGVAALLLQMAL